VELQFLLDTHIVIRWLTEPRKLNREQTRVLEDAERRGAPLAVSAISLLEIAGLFAKDRLSGSMAAIFEKLDREPLFVLLPITVEIAAAVATLGGTLTDPADRAIVATARVHRLRLVTSDQRIVASKLVPVVE